MNMYIGENIKRLRLAKNITQEKLAEYLNISAPAVSKWERGETLPDITMVVPLASYFGVTSDELLGFDEAAEKADIQKRLEEYFDLQRAGMVDKCPPLIIALRKEYPNDFLVAVIYMWELIGGRADNSQEILLKYADEFMPICERILNESTTTSTRTQAAHIMAKIYNARGEYEKAVACLDDIPNLYATKNQLLEQLHAKDTEEFRYLVNKNMDELLGLAFNKAGKAIWYTCETVESREAATHQLAAAIEGYINVSGYELAYSFIAWLYHEGGKVLNIEKQYDKAAEFYAAYLAYLKKLDAFISSDRSTAGVPGKVKDYNAKLHINKYKDCATWLQNTPFLEELRKTEKFQKVLEENSR